jgi:hypothetical protein
MSRTRPLLLIAVGWLAFLSALLFFLSQSSSETLREHLRAWQFWFLEVQLVLSLVLAAFNLPRLVTSLRLTRTDIGFLTGACLLTGVLAGYVAPRTNRIFYDEQIYQNVGQNLADSRLAQMCNEGTVEYGTLQCWRPQYNKQPTGYPHLLSVVYRVTGTAYWTATRFNVGCAIALVAVVFLIAFGLFEDPWTARFAALIMALIPEQLLWAHSGAGEPSAALTTALAVLAATHFKRTSETAALAWTIVATVFAMQFKTESVLAAIVVGAAVLLFLPFELGRPRFWGWALVGAVLASAAVCHLVAVRGEDWGASGDRFAVGFFLPNLRVNSAFFLGDARFPAFYTVLAVAGLVARTLPADTRRLREAALCGVYFLAFWVIYLFFYAGSYNYGADVRFSLMAYPPVALLAGAGTGELIRRMQSRGWASSVTGPALVAAVLFQFTWYLPLVRNVGEEAWAARADVAFSEEFARTLPKNAFVFTHNPNVFHLMGVNAGQISMLVTEKPYVSAALMTRYSGGVYMYWNFWCNVPEPAQRQLCRSALAQFPSKLVSERLDRDYRFAFYRLDAASALPMRQP